MNKTIAAIFAFLAVSCAAGPVSAISVADPRCEDMRDPVGVVESVPRFSWRFDGKESLSPPAFAELRLSASEEDLVAGRNLIWSKRTSRQDIFSCMYDGPVLASGTPYRWQVRLVFEDRTSTSWCPPARFTIAIRGRESWEGARWIGEPLGWREWRDIDYEVRISSVTNGAGLLFRVNPDSDGYLWRIDFSGSVPLLRPGIFRGGRVESLKPYGAVPGVDPAKEHTLRVSLRGRSIRTFLDGKEVDARFDDTFASGTVGLRCGPGERALADDLRVTGADGREILYDGFKGHFAPAFLEPKVAGDKLVLDPSSVQLHNAPLPKSCPLLRKTFALKDKPVRHAFASVCGFGFYELWMNGCAVDPSRTLAPAMASTDRASLFDTFDVTRFLKPGGSNTVGFVLAAGYSDDFSRFGWHWLKPKAAVLHLAVTYADGERQIIVSDATWSMKDGCEVAYASIYGGETIYGDRRDDTWCTASGTSDGWGGVVTRPLDYAAPLVPNEAPPVRRSDPRRPVSVKETSPGVFTADFGQNRAGVVEARVKGPKGTVIRLRTSELLGKDGRIDPWTNTKAKSEDVFVLAGTGNTETFLPRFTYHGFRYVEITGWPGRPSCDDLTAWAVHADVEPRGSFRCSDEGLNRLDNAARWSMRSNFVSYPTDCCMRAERTPCRMDSQVYEDTALLYFGMARYYSKWMDDIREDRGNPDSAGDAATLPWRLWTATGDRRHLSRNYATVRRLVDSYAAETPDLIREKGYGDWCAPNIGRWSSFFNDVGVVNTALFCEMARVARDSAAVLGKDEDAVKYGALYDRAKKAFHKRFYDPERRAYGDGSQATAVLPLAFGIVPEECRQAVEKALVDRIRYVDGSKIDTGIFGTRYIGDVLCDIGEADLLVRLFTQPEYPGFGYMFANGATTLWEQWSYKGGMNSHNHAMNSGSAHVLITRIGGIRASAPGYAGVEIRPVFPTGMHFAEAVHVTPRGEVSVRWRRTGEKVEIETKIPPFMPARLVLPGRPAEKLGSGIVKTLFTP